jgi:homopolymeric O-antigen transport system permease protein
MATREHQAPPRVARDGSAYAGRAHAAVFEVAGGPGHLSWSSFAELWEYREVLRAFVARQLKVRYKQAVVGAGWVVIQPLVGAALFALFLGHYAKIGSEGVPYLLFALAGMAVWGYFTGACTTGADSLVANQNLLRKIYFPREILPLTPVLSGLVDLAIGLGVFIVAALIEGITPSWQWLAIPLPALILVWFAAAIAIGLSSLNIYYRDVRYVLPFVLQIGLFASPITYSLSLIPTRWRDVYAILNPIAAAVDALRRMVLHGKWPDPLVTFGALAWSMLLALLAYALFKRLERGFSDRV